MSHKTKWQCWIEVVVDHLLQWLTQMCRYQDLVFSLCLLVRWVFSIKKYKECIINAVKKGKGSTTLKGRLIAHIICTAYMHSFFISILLASRRYPVGSSTRKKRKRTKQNIEVSLTHVTIFGTQNNTKWKMHDTQTQQNHINSTLFCLHRHHCYSLSG